MRLPIKPLTQNRAWTGKRFRTKAYRKYISDVCLLLPRFKVPVGPLYIRIIWGFSNAGSDIDNPAKLFIDCLQKKYDFNDNRVYKLTLLKDKVPKGQEYIEFDLKSFEETA